MKKNKRLLFLPKYYEWIEAGKMSVKGLCYQWDTHPIMEAETPSEIFSLIEPSSYEIEHRRDWLYWGSNSVHSEQYVFTPLRQNLVLLMAALNNEL